MDGYFSRRRGSFKAYLTIQANPSATITATGDRATYSGVADNGTGLLMLEIKKKGVYTLTTSNNANSNAEGNNSTINIDKTGGRYNAQLVKINVPDSLGVANYSSNALTAYWTRPTTNWSGVNLRRNTGSAPSNREAGSSVYSGVGNAGIALNASSTVNGYTNTGLTASTTYYYSIFSYLNINNLTYWSTTYRTGAATATDYVGLSTTITGTQSWSIPTGWRSIQIFGVGGGGGGAGGAVNARGGGGGGYTRTSGAISVTPGTSYAIEIGSGGSGGTSGAGTDGKPTKFGSLFTAPGGQGGRQTTGTTVDTQSGGNGGSGGGAQGVYTGGSLDAPGTNGASDGGNAASNTYYRQQGRYLGGTGQGSTTRAWGSSSGTLYAGGGGGGGRQTEGGGSGGAGGGGRGSSSYTASGTAGTNNTGGGGGGGAWSNSAGRASAGGNGGSGIMIIKCVA